MSYEIFINSIPTIPPTRRDMPTMPFKTTVIILRMLTNLASDVPVLITSTLALLISCNIY